MSPQFQKVIDTSISVYILWHAICLPLMLCMKTVEQSKAVVANQVKTAKQHNHINNSAFAAIKFSIL